MFWKIVRSQIRHTWGAALLIFVAMTALVTLYVYSTNTTKFANRSMELVMKNMGHNLLIVPEGADPESVYVCSDRQVLFPEDTAQRMSRALNLSSRYYVSVLQGRVKVEGHELLLTGIQPVARKDETREKGNMVLPLREREARLGSESARKLGKQVGHSVRIQGENFQVVDVLPPKATVDDCRVYISLPRCQKMLAKEGQISFILSFLCLHSGSLERALEVQEQKLAERFPGFRQISRMDIAQGRHLARMTTQKSLAYLLAFVAAATIAVIVVTGLQEVADRKQETGILVAMGVSHSYLVGLYLVKTLLLALTSAVMGFYVGSVLAVQFSTPFLVVNTEPVAILWRDLPTTAALTCAVAVAAEAIPMIRLLSLDPTTILAEQ